MLGTHSRLGVLALCSALVLAGCSNSSGPADTVKRFYRAVEESDLKAASRLFSGNAADPAKLQAALSLYSSEIASRQGIESIEILSEEIEGNTAVVRARLTFGDGTTDSQRTNLVRIDGRWMISADSK